MRRSRIGVALRFTFTGGRFRKIRFIAIDLAPPLVRR
jgi:hypothetical protein